MCCRKFLFFILLIPLAPFWGLSQTFTSSNLPLVLINTNGQTIVDDPKINAKMGIIWNGPGQRNQFTDPQNDFYGNICIEIRGSSSQDMFPKKSYGFETKSIEMLDMDVSLLGMPEENDWILYAPYTDKTMIRDVLTYTLDASMGHYSPRCRYVELFVNNKYEGLYVLMEKIKRNKNRVDIAKLLPTDITGENLTGGYIIKIDKGTGGGGDGWHSDYVNVSNNTWYQYDYPKSKEITSEQRNYIQSYVRNMEKALFLEKFTGTGSYHEYLNDTSFIDFMIINELSRNIDGYRLSSFLYKGKNDKMNCGPIWDFNLTYGNANYYDGWKTTGFEYQIDFGGDYWQNPFWWNKLMRDPAFVIKLKKRWSRIRKNEFSNQRIRFVTDSLVSVLSEAQIRNYQRWPGVMGNWIWPNYYVGTSYAAEVSWLNTWITQRLAFLDKNWFYDLTGTEDQLVARSADIYPNPFTDQLNVQLPVSTNGQVFAEMINSSGVLISKNSVDIQNGQLRLDFTEKGPLSPGLYVLRIIQDNKVLLREKIVKK